MLCSYVRELEKTIAAASAIASCSNTILFAEFPRLRVEKISQLQRLSHKQHCRIRGHLDRCRLPHYHDVSRLVLLERDTLSFRIRDWRP